MPKEMPRATDGSHEWTESRRGTPPEHITDVPNTTIVDTHFKTTRRFATLYESGHLYLGYTDENDTDHTLIVEGMTIDSTTRLLDTWDSDTDNAIQTNNSDTILHNDTTKEYGGCPTCGGQPQFIKETEDGHQCNLCGCKLL